MIRIILTLAFVLLAWSGKAAEPITYYSLTGKSTPHLFLIESWVKEMKKEISIDWRPGLSCGGTSSWLEDKKPKIVEFVSGRVWQSLDEDNNDCIIDYKNLQYISLVEYYYDICVPHDSKIKNVHDIIAHKKLTMAHGSGTALHKWAGELNRLYGSNVKPIAFKASGDAMLATLSGDTDFAFVSTLIADQNLKSGKIRCIASTMPNQDNSLNKLLPKINVLLNNHVNLFPLASAGLDQRTLQLAKQSVKKASAQFELPKGLKIYLVENKEEDNQIKEKVRSQIEQLHQYTKNLR